MARGGGMASRAKPATDPLAKLLLDYAKECKGKPDCGLRDGGGAAHRCRCAYCQGFKRLQLKIKKLRQQGVRQFFAAGRGPMLFEASRIIRVRKITRLR